MVVLLKRVLAAGLNLKELIVVDDGSKDATRERVAELAATDPRVRLLPQRQNCGKGAALRAGPLRRPRETSSSCRTPTSNMIRRNCRA